MHLTRKHTHEDSDLHPCTQPPLNLTRTTGHVVSESGELIDAHIHQSVLAYILTFCRWLTRPHICRFVKLPLCPRGNLTCVSESEPDQPLTTKKVRSTFLTHCDVEHAVTALSSLLALDGENICLCLGVIRFLCGFRKGSSFGLNDTSSAQ